MSTGPISTNAEPMEIEGETLSTSTSTSTIKTKEGGELTILRGEVVEPPLPIEPPPKDSHACELRITFPTNLQAEQAKQVMEVDKEPTDRVKKSFRLETTEKDGKPTVSLVVRFESKELKMLRVAVSSFTDYMAVVVNTMREFDDTAFDSA